MIAIPRSALLAVAATLLLACSGAKNEDKGAWEAREGSNFVGNGNAADSSWTGTTEHSIGFDWVGVRPDLGINPSRPRAQTCSCLTVEVGSPSDKKFVWRGARPDVQNANLAVAISSAGIDCPGGASNAGDRRPSISGVFRDDKGDVFVEIEEAYEDRPIATGAIIAPPDARGSIYVRPRLKTLPYARPSAGSPCRVK
jgi:hypothetical protein